MFRKTKPLAGRKVPEYLNQRNLVYNANIEGFACLSFSKGDHDGYQSLSMIYFKKGTSLDAKKIKEELNSINTNQIFRDVDAFAKEANSMIGLNLLNGDKSRKQEVLNQIKLT